MTLHCPLCNVEVSPPEGGWIDRAELGCAKCASTVLVRRKKSPVGELTWLELLVDGDVETARVALEDAALERASDEAEARDKALEASMAEHGLGGDQTLMFQSMDLLTFMGGIRRVRGKLEVFGAIGADMQAALDRWCEHGISELAGQGIRMRDTKPDAPQFLTRLFWYSTRALPVHSSLTIKGLDRRGLQLVLACGEDCPEVTIALYEGGTAELHQRLREP